MGWSKGEGKRAIVGGSWVKERDDEELMGTVVWQAVAGLEAGERVWVADGWSGCLMKEKRVWLAGGKLVLG